MSGHIHLCFVCGAEAPYACGGCRKVMYCSRDCQKRDFIISHRGTCNLMRDGKPLVCTVCGTASIYGCSCSACGISIESSIPVCITEENRGQNRKQKISKPPGYMEKLIFIRSIYVPPSYDPSAIDVKTTIQLVALPGGQRKVALKLSGLMTPSRHIHASLFHDLEIRNLDHPNIIGSCAVGPLNGNRIPAIENFSDPNMNAIGFVMDNAEMNLNSYGVRSRKAGDMTIDDLLIISYQMITSIAYCHENLIVHCDVKPHNFLVYGRQVIYPDGNVRVFPQIMLCDFATSCGYCFENQEWIRTGTQDFIDEEDQKEVTPFAMIDRRRDVYACGVSIRKLMTALSKTEYKTLGGYSKKKVRDYYKLIQSSLERLISTMVTNRICRISASKAMLDGVFTIGLISPMYSGMSTKDFVAKALPNFKVPNEVPLFFERKPRLSSKAIGYAIDPWYVLRLLKKRSKMYYKPNIMGNPGTLYIAWRLAKVAVTMNKIRTPFMAFAVYRSYRTKDRVESDIKNEGVKMKLASFAVSFDSIARRYCEYQISCSNYSDCYDEVISLHHSAIRDGMPLKGTLPTLDFFILDAIDYDIYMPTSYDYMRMLCIQRETLEDEEIACYILLLFSETQVDIFDSEETPRHVTELCYSIIRDSSKNVITRTEQEEEREEVVEEELEKEKKLEEGEIEQEEPVKGEEIEKLEEEMYEKMEGEEEEEKEYPKKKEPQFHLQPYADFLYELYNRFQNLAPKTHFSEYDFIKDLIDAYSTKGKKDIKENVEKIIKDRSADVTKIIEENVEKIIKDRKENVTKIIDAVFDIIGLAISEFRKKEELEEEEEKVVEKIVSPAKQKRATSYQPVRKGKKGSGTGGYSCT